VTELVYLNRVGAPAGVFSRNISAVKRALEERGLSLVMQLKKEDQRGARFVVRPNDPRNTIPTAVLKEITDRHGGDRWTINSATI
jgi:hypothetical protein